MATRKNKKVRRDVARAIARDAAGREGAATMTARERRAIIREGRGQFKTRLSSHSEQAYLRQVRINNAIQSAFIPNKPLSKAELDAFKKRLGSPCASGWSEARFDPITGKPFAKLTCVKTSLRKVVAKTCTRLDARKRCVWKSRILSRR